MRGFALARRATAKPTTPPAPATTADRPQIRHILRGPRVHTKLRVGAPDDPAEREADRVADQVMRMPDPAVATTSAPIGVQRLCAECEEDVRRQPVEEEEELLQTKEVAGRTPVVTPSIAADIASLRGGGRHLPASERAFFEPRLGHDLSQVRIHTGPRADAAARAIEARAFVAGSDIAFAQGAYTPGIMAHELAHVIMNEHGLVRRYGYYYGYGAYGYYPYLGGGGGPPCSGAAATPPADFCRPFATRAAALADRDDPPWWAPGSVSKGVTVLAGATAAAQGSGVAADLYAKFIYGGSATVEDASAGARDFTDHDTTAFVTKKLVSDALGQLTAGREDVFAALANDLSSHIDMPVAAHQQAAVDDQSSAYALNFCGLNLPGIIAGGIGKTQTSGANLGADTSAARNDQRGVDGDFHVTAERRSSAELHLTVVPHLIYHVTDTVDFCPGNPGGWSAEFLTVPLSRWEASGISGDVTFELDFGAPAITGAITLEHRNGLVNARDPSLTGP